MSNSQPWAQVTAKLHPTWPLCTSRERNNITWSLAYSYVFILASKTHPTWTFWPTHSGSAWESFNTSLTLQIHSSTLSLHVDVYCCSTCVKQWRWYHLWGENWRWKAPVWKQMVRTKEVWSPDRPSLIPRLVGRAWEWGYPRPLLLSASSMQRDTQSLSSASFPGSAHTRAWEWG